MTKNVFVGPPLTRVDVQCDHVLAGREALITNRLWGLTEGRTRCRIIGYSPTAQLAKRPGVYAIRDIENGRNYPVAAEQLETLLPKNLSSLL